MKFKDTIQGVIVSREIVVFHFGVREDSKKKSLRLGKIEYRFGRKGNWIQVSLLTWAHSTQKVAGSAPKTLMSWHH